MHKCNRLFWIFSLSIILIQPAWATNIVENIGDEDNQITVIYLKGQPYDLGYIHGSVLREQVTALYNSLLNAVSQYGAPYLLDLAYKQMEPYIPQAYKDEMQGLADGAGINVNTVHRVHAIPDLSEMDCSFFAAWGNATVDGNLYQIRALDYATDWHLQEHPAILVCEPDSGRRFVNVGWVGFIGVVSGMNYDGIAVSEIGDSFDKSNHTLAAEPMPFVLRDVLQYSGNLDHAVEIIQNAKRTSSYLYCVGDAEIPQARSFKAGPRFCDVYTDQRNPNPFLDDIVYFSMGVSSSWNSKIYNYLNARHGSISYETGKDLMHQLGTGDLHSVVYDPAHGKLWVANAGVDGTDAFDRTFVEFDLSRADSIFASYSVARVNYKKSELPIDFKLYQNYPNPFNPVTQIEFEIPKATVNKTGTTELAVFDLNGQKVATLVKAFLSPGYYKLSWNGRDYSGLQVSSGFYFYRLTAGSHDLVRRMLLIR